jgi:hypothetical protein
MATAVSRLSDLCPAAGEYRPLMTSGLLVIEMPVFAGVSETAAGSFVVPPSTSATKHEEPTIAPIIKISPRGFIVDVYRAAPAHRPGGGPSSLIPSASPTLFRRGIFRPIRQTRTYSESLPKPSRRRPPPPRTSGGCARRTVVTSVGPAFRRKVRTGGTAGKGRLRTATCRPPSAPGPPSARPLTVGGWAWRAGPPGRAIVTAWRRGRARPTRPCPPWPWARRPEGDDRRRRLGGICGYRRPWSRSDGGRPDLRLDVVHGLQHRALAPGEEAVDVVRRQKAWPCRSPPWSSPASARRQEQGSHCRLPRPAVDAPPPGSSSSTTICGCHVQQSAAAQARAGHQLRRSVGPQAVAADPAADRGVPLRRDRRRTLSIKSTSFGQPGAATFLARHPAFPPIRL